MQVVVKTKIDAYPLVGRGKVRDIYHIDDGHLLIVTTDRMSAFDVVMNEAIPYKGVILNKITLFWMEKFKHIIPNHLVETDVARFPPLLDPWKEQLEGRSVIVRKAHPLPVECIVRGYITGSGWEAYRSAGSVCGHELPAGLRESDKLEPALFTPSTKAELGSHDENISRDQARQLLGEDVAEQVERISLAIYEAGRAHAAQRGIIVADTKFEFGLIDGKLHLIDEVLTPDSSRFWPADQYHPGQGQPSFDKQFLRDWLKKQPWNKQPPPPALPESVITATAERYQEAFDILTR
ncbi:MULTISPECIES: phosphoribosylaminoimidazolesuccinocarboxamide synthase [unclassified Desulfovibrio]|uniref:phosphoribosylaminoimidazolesuccinocarboxamide synthase n=1 Tax=unclassified Desulfovibrio TaxID=2593640 RepID=UPI000F5EFBD9|nr:MULTISPECIES: phosphoribosylaminoimidazolesuccinocarboxamide synthase [unclassified Desulfovibrio]RRD69583.1 phosphoribosylaminoimidazolesuccinocarboxamide synthase [Desulfovibrio sp. OH1209_COT-279]RRD86243.1 phosphoribosylaminoimidazolesuccinocarboxamide synthase [Desulfovibrio sp. OH1186_COT-070]